MNLTLKVWRQKHSAIPGIFETYQAKDVLEDMSFLEMLDVVNEDIIAAARSRSRSTPIAGKESAACARW
jgi:hypothetical protein